MVAEVIDTKLEQVNARFDQVDARFDQVDARFEQVDAKFEQFKADVIYEFDHRLTLHNEIHHKGIAVIAEGHQMLSEKLERVEVRIDHLESELSKKIDRIAADVAAHRADTEAHHGIYRVKES
ncbi:MAG TPA: hypothetical protein DDY22_08740 [Geobacter sp.]|nr:hypothetical protein [Geobacter sp.]